MTSSKQQELIYKWFAEPDANQPNAIANAVAGSGKTTTCRIGFSHAPEKNMFYGVFGKKNEVEAKEKITDPRLTIKTWHAEGFSLVRNVWRNAKPDSDIEGDRLDYVAKGKLNDFPEARAMILKLVEFSKGQFINPTREQLEALADEIDIYFNNGFVGDAFSLALAQIEESKNKNSQTKISFIDMVWLPLAMGWTMPRYPLVCCDEVQDLCPTQLMLARASVMPTGRMICVGDTRQTIYGWRGASHNGMETMQRELNAKKFHLTTSYRCPRAIEKMVQEIVPRFSVHDNAIEGEVVSVKHCDDARPGDFILSRLNAPLMPLALNLLRQKIPARIEGRDIGRQLLTMVKSQKAKSVPHFFEKINSWFEKQVARIGKVKGYEKKIETSQDIKDTLYALAENCNSIQEVEQRIYSLFQDTDKTSKPAVILSTVHRAKGLEADRVFMLMSTFQNRRAGNEIEEANVKYVAITRAKVSLFLVNAN
jgi:hypothetical protein